MISESLDHGRPVRPWEGYLQGDVESSFSFDFQSPASMLGMFANMTIHAYIDNGIHHHTRNITCPTQPCATQCNARLVPMSDAQAINSKVKQVYPQRTGVRRPSTAVAKPPDCSQDTSGSRHLRAAVEARTRTGTRRACWTAEVHITRCFQPSDLTHDTGEGRSDVERLDIAWQRRIMK